VADKPRTIKQETARFSIDTQLLPELGERLFNSPQIALAELVKNAYDADATSCYIWLEDSGNRLVVQDNGYGMTEAEFLEYWMTVATIGKLRMRQSRSFSRAITGSKGVGRFAVRHLGRALKLESTAEDPSAKKYLRLSALFDWDAFKPGQPLDTVNIEYKIESGFGAADRGTRLTMGKLQRDWTPEMLKQVTEGVLDIVSHPFVTGIGEAPIQSKRDPGFSLFFSRPGAESVQESATRELVERYIARVMIEVREKLVRFSFQYRGRKSKEYKYALEETLVGDLHGEIRFYPRRGGLFLGMRTMDGRSASRWLSEHGGVRIIDRGFRVPPYGDRDDDWLHLAASKAANERFWRSTITESLFPSEALSKEGELSPFLYLPTSHQLLGAIYVTSYRPETSGAAKDRIARLQPAMDRQGFVENEAFAQLRTIIRAAVELLAVVDVEETSKEKLRLAKTQAREAQQSLKRAIELVRADKTIRPPQKREIIQSYEEVAKQVSKMEYAYEQARQTIEAMYLLGVLAAFMTHETTVMLRATSTMVDRIRSLQRRVHDPELESALSEATTAQADLKGHVDYTKAFLGSLREGKVESFKVGAQASYVTKQFVAVTEPRSIHIENKIPEDLVSPPINVAIYTGVLMNLFTNAIKAVLAVEAPKRGRTIRLEAVNEGPVHVLRVSDTGIGIPPGLEERIFDPLFTTTGTEGPLGSGMGLGLYIVKKVLHEVSASVDLVEPPEGFRTCFEVRIRS